MRESKVLKAEEFFLETTSEQHRLLTAGKLSKSTTDLLRAGFRAGVRWMAAEAEIQIRKTSRPNGVETHSQT